MKEVQFLGRAFGEFVSTGYSIIAVYEGQDYPKDEMHNCIVNNDFWMPVQKPKYTILNVMIPDWMNPFEYDSHKWKWYQAIGGNEELGREAYEKLIKIQNGALRLACVKLLKTKSFKSPIRESLKEHLVQWINNDSKYDNPFSYKQQQVLVNEYIKREAKQIGVY